MEERNYRNNRNTAFSSRYAEDSDNGYAEYGEYLDGNAVRVAEPEERPDRVYVDGRRVNESPRRLRERERALSINGAYAAFLAVSVVVCLALCIYYLNVQAQIKETRSNISSLSSEITTLTTENEALDYEINSYVDLDYIYDVAMNELGMVRANGDQVSVYERSDSEYVSQTDDIPEE